MAAKFRSVHNMARQCRARLHQIRRASHNASTLTITDVAKNLEQKWQEEAVLYVHWPYCERRCTYCNFNKYISNDVDEERMKKCLTTELQNLLTLSGVKIIKSIFFGGGTPSLALPTTLAGVIDTVNANVRLAADAEITIEVNPTSAQTEKLRDFRDIGINRVSLGVQALNDAELKSLGRDHTVNDALRCLDECRTLFAGRSSVDLMYGRPGQSLADWTHELNQMLSLCDDHISLYQLTLERGTALFKQILDRELMLPGTDVVADMYEAAVDTLEKAGFTRYEVSNFTRNNAESSHNQAYWRGVQYIGIGPGAHGRFVCAGRDSQETGLRESRIQTLEPKPWMYEVEKFGHGTRKVVQQTALEVLEELVMLGLRTKAGVYNERWHMLSGGLNLSDVFSDAYMTRMFQAEGFMTITDSSMQATPKGMNVVDSITPHLINILRSHYDVQLT